MKTIKTLLSATALVAIFSMGAFAQTAEVNVSATVNAALTLTPTAVALGTIQQDVISTLAANASDGTSANVGTTAAAGSLQIQGTTGSSVEVSWTNATLSDGATGTPVTATFTPSVWLGAAELATPGGSNVTVAGGSATLDIGGTLAAISSPGTFATNVTGGSPITFTVQYN